MKKIASLLLSLSIIFTSCAYAEEIKQITKESIFYIKAIHTIPENAFKNFSIFNPSQSKEMQKELVLFIKSCQPYNENININFFGLDATLNIQSKGRIEQKCSYEITGKINKIPEELVASTGMPSSDIYKIEPKLNCEFTQEQLDTLVDSISETITELSQQSIQMSKSQAKQNLKNKLANDEKLKAVFKNSNACQLTGLSKENL